jgi:hypothetical protein
VSRDKIRKTLESVADVVLNYRPESKQPKPKPRKEKTMRGFGTLYRQEGSKYWWITYYRGRTRFRESTHKTRYREAQQVLKQKIKESAEQS